MGEELPRGAPAAASAHAHARATSWSEAVARCADALDGVAPAGADLGFVYFTEPFAPHAGAILEALRLRTGVAHWVGTAGLGICATGVEHFQVPALAVLVADFPPDAFRIFSATGPDLTAFDAAHGTWCDGHAPAFAVVHGDPRDPSLAARIAALSARMGGGFLTGGLTSSSGSFPQIADGVTDGGLSGVLFASGTPVATRLTQGCRPIGDRHRITACRGNVCQELDGRPAAEVLMEDGGELLSRQPDQMPGFLFAGLPVAGSDTGDYLVRNILGIDAGRGLVAVGAELEPDGWLMFCRRDLPSAEQDLARAARALRGAAPAPARGSLYFSCLARGPSLFGPGSRELELVRAELGDGPLIGFFGNGEISHDRLYAYTGVLASFS